MKYIVALLFVALLVFFCTIGRTQTPHNCVSWRGQVFQDQADGTFVIVDNQVLYSFNVDGDPQTYTFGPYGDPTSAQTLTVSVAAVDWFGLEDGPALVACQWTLGYRVNAANLQFFKRGF